MLHDEADREGTNEDACYHDDQKDRVLGTVYGRLGYQIYDISGLLIYLDTKHPPSICEHIEGIFFHLRGRCDVISIFAERVG